MADDVKREGPELVGSGGAGPAPPGFVAKLSVSYELATRMLEAGFAKADEMGRPAIIAVVDEGGNLVAFGRQEGSAMVGVGISQKKAMTALGVGMGTQDMWEYLSQEQELTVGICGDPDLMVVGGGLPIVIDGQLAGAIGASGGHYSEDIEVAEAAMAVVPSSTAASNGAG